MLTRKLFFRSWFYFRQGWSLYFAFLFAAINTLTTTYFLAIEKYPTLKAVFPTFFQYVLFAFLIGVPILIVIGFVHFKKSGAFKSEVDITIESNPHQRRILLNTEALLVLCIKTNDILIKTLKNEKLSEQESEELIRIQDELKEHLNDRTIQNHKKKHI